MGDVFSLRPCDIADMSPEQLEMCRFYRESMRTNG